MELLSDSGRIAGSGGGLTRAVVIGTGRSSEPVGTFRGLKPSVSFIYRYPQAPKERGAESEQKSEARVPLGSRTLPSKGKQGCGSQTDEKSKIKVAYVIADQASPHIARDVCAHEVDRHCCASAGWKFSLSRILRIITLSWRNARR